jgi:hypothetical protein
MTQDRTVGSRSGTPTSSRPPCPAFTHPILVPTPTARSQGMYWLDMNDRTLVLVLLNGIGAHLTNDEKRAHLTDLKREHLIDHVCVQEIIPPEKE